MIYPQNNFKTNHRYNSEILNTFKSRQTDRPTQKQTDRPTQTHIQTDTNTDTDRHTDRQTERQTHRQTDRHKHRYRQTDRHTDRQTDTNTHTDRHKHKYRQKRRQIDRRSDIKLIKAHRQTDTFQKHQILSKTSPTPFFSSKTKDLHGGRHNDKTMFNSRRKKRRLRHRYGLPLMLSLSPAKTACRDWLAPDRKTTVCSLKP